MSSKGSILYPLISFDKSTRIRIRQCVRDAGRHPTLDEKHDIERKRQRIAARIRDFHMTSTRLFAAPAIMAVLGTPDRLNTDGYVSDEVRRPEDRGLPVSSGEIENTILVFPSAIPGNVSAHVTDLRDRECRLRRAKANDTLGHVRETLSGLSYQYINKVRQSITTRDHLRATAGVKRLSKEVSFYQQVYNRNSRALWKLDPALKVRYPRLQKADCSISTAIADVNAAGQSQTRLPWLWAARDGWDGEPTAAQNSLLDNNRLLECKRCFYRLVPKLLTN